MILIVDFGSQTAHMIGRRLKSIGVEVKYGSPEEAFTQAHSLKPKGIILSGGPDSVNDPMAPMIDPKIFQLGVPILGICYGWQLMAKLLGGIVVNENGEYGPEEVVFKDNIFHLEHASSIEIMSHGDYVKELPPGFKIAASTKNVLCAAAYHPIKHLYGIQYHPELNIVERESHLLKYFVEVISSCELHPQEIDLQEMVNKIKMEVGDSEVICGISGGVDSTVAATLIQQAIGSKLLCVYIENGLMAEDTEKRVLETFKQAKVIHAKQKFLDTLKGITDSEEKRKIIGKIYAELFEEVAKSNPRIKFLAQGTIYSDVIESKGTDLASHIKSHHNVGGLPKNLSLKLLEPLRYYYKDEVREMGYLLKIDRKILTEHPFPGPGYAIRMRGEVTGKRLSQVKLADHILKEELKKAGLYDQLFQCFCVMTGATSSAVKGDEGVFAEVVAIRAYTSIDVMSSTWANLPYEVLQTISSRILNEVPAVSRVVYDISTKPPSTMEWE